MKRIFYLYILVSCVYCCPAQSIAPAVINAMGGGRVIGTTTFEWSVGEPVAGTLTNTFVITPGVIQPQIQTPLPVKGLDFTAQRTNAAQVQLDWKTKQEANCKGFYIERKTGSGNSFESIDFVASQAPGGNSNLPLSYSYIDKNNFSGDTWYRLKQVDLDGKFAYSIIRTVPGNAAKTVAMKVWPVPNNGNFTVSVQGIDTYTVVSIIRADGSLMRQLTIKKDEDLPVRGLQPGVYFLKAKGLPVVEIIVN